MKKLLIIILSLLSTLAFSQTILKIEGKTYVISGFEVSQSGRVLEIKGASESLKNHVYLAGAKCDQLPARRKVAGLAKPTKGIKPKAKKATPSPFQSLLNDLKGGYSGISSSFEEKGEYKRDMR